MFRLSQSHLFKPGPFNKCHDLQSWSLYNNPQKSGTSINAAINATATGLVDMCFNPKICIQIHFLIDTTNMENLNNALYGCAKFRDSFQA